MLNKEEYQRNLIRMWDTLRTEHEGEENCEGIRCIDCPFDGKTCNTVAPNFRACEAIETVENWAKEHQIKTNADKFREMFGTEPSKSTCVNDIDCENCEYYVNGECDVCDQFWNAEYTEPAESEDK